MRAELTANLDIDITAIKRIEKSGIPVDIMLGSIQFSGHDTSTFENRIALLSAGMTANMARCEQSAGTDPDKWKIIALGAGITANMAWCDKIAGTGPDKWKIIALGAGMTANMDWCEKVAEKNPDKWKFITLGAGITANMNWCKKIAEKNPDNWKLIAKGAGMTGNPKWCTELTEKDEALKDQIAVGAGQSCNMEWCEKIAEETSDNWKHIAQGAGQSCNLKWCTQLIDKDPALKGIIAMGAGMTGNVEWCIKVSDINPALKDMIALGAGLSANMAWCKKIAGIDSNKWLMIAKGAGMSTNMAWCKTVAEDDDLKWHGIALGAGMSANMAWCKTVAEDDDFKWHGIAAGAGLSANIEWCELLAKKDPDYWPSIATSAAFGNNIAFSRSILTKANAHEDVSYPDLIKTLISLATEYHREATLIDLLRAAPHPLATEDHREATSIDLLRTAPQPLTTSTDLFMQLSDDIFEEKPIENYKNFFTMCSNLGQYTLENPLSMVTFYNQFPTELLAGTRLEIATEENHLKITKICQSIISIREDNGCSSLTAEQLAHAAYENTPLALRTPLVYFSDLCHSSARFDSQSISNPGLPSKILSPVLAVLVKHAIPYLENRQYKENLLLAQSRHEKREILRAQKQLATRRACKLKEKEPLCTVMLALYGTHILPFLTTNWTHEQSLQLQPMFERKYAAAQHLEQKIKQQFKIQATCIAYLLGLNKLTISTAADLSAKDTRLIADIFFHKLLKDFILKYVGMSTRPLTPQIKRTKEWATGFLKKNNPLNITEASYTKFDLLMRHTKKDRDSIKTSLSEEKLTRVGDAGTPPPGSDYQLLLLGGGATSPTLLKQLVDSCRILQSFYDSQTDTSAPFSRSTVDRRLFGPPSEDTLERIVDTRTPTERETELKNASKITALTNIEEDLREWAFYP